MLLGMAAWVIVHFVPVLPEHRDNDHKAFVKHGLSIMEQTGNWNGGNTKRFV